MKTRKELVLAKYVRRHHPTDQIIGDKEARPMTRSRLRSETFFLSKVEPKIIGESLHDDEWYKAMKEEIEKIERLQEIRQDWFAKDIHMRKELTMERHFPCCKTARSNDFSCLCYLQRI